MGRKSDKETPGSTVTTNKTRAAEPKLLAGGNPQIPKGSGEEPIQAWIAAAPGWKGEIARRLDETISQAVPEVQKAVKWNTPLYGLGGGTYFAAFHAFAKYIKVTFFRGDQLVPSPPEPSKQKGVRYFHIREGDAFPEAQLLDWMKQAAALPGERL